jgi:hypothetical protein
MLTLRSLIPKQVFFFQTASFAKIKPPYIAFDKEELTRVSKSKYALDYKKPDASSPNYLKVKE